MSRCVVYEAFAEKENEFSFSYEIRGFHMYKHTWTPTVGQTVYGIHEEGNPYDNHAIALTTSKKGW